MKKEYQKPALFCEELRPETLLCGCVLKNPSYNEVQMCGYELEGLPASLKGLKIFAQNWVDCNGSAFADMSQYCYNAGPTNIFGS